MACECTLKLLLCGELFDPVVGAVVPRSIVVVEGERIAWRGPFEGLGPRYGLEVAGLTVGQAADRMGAELIDLSACFVMPGLIEGHAHIGMDSALSMERMLLHGGYGEITVRSIRNAQANLLAGFTTVRDECSFAYIDVDVRNLIDAGELWGPRLRVSGMALSSLGGHADLHLRPGISPLQFPESHIAYLVNGADEARQAARSAIKHGADVIKLMATGGVLSNDESVGAPDLMYEEMRAACEVARAHGKTVSAHAHGAEGIKSALRAGVTSIEHGSMIDEEGCELLVAHGAYIVPTLVAHRASVRKGEAGAIPSAQYRKAMIVEECAARGLSKLRELGARIGFGTDAGTPGNPHGRQHDEFRLMMEQGGLSAIEVLRSATVVNAKLIGMSESVGSLEPGKYADVVAFDRSPLKSIDAMGSCSFVMKGGVVYRRCGVATIPCGL